jgi:hypothetical protein
MSINWFSTSPATSRELNLSTSLEFVKNTSTALDTVNQPYFKLGGHSSLEALRPALQLAVDQLQEFAGSPEFNAKMTLAFGTGWDVKKAIDFAKSWVNQDFSQLPQIEIVLGTDISGANGAFAAETNKIYLSSNFLTQNANHPNAITSVVLEEIGHFIDSRLNATDSPGDEGDIFSRLVRGVAISANELAELKVEDDHAWVSIGGKSTEIEMSQIAMASLNGRFYQSHQGMDNKIYTRSSTDGVNWSGWNNNGGGETLNAPSLTALNGRLYQSHRGMDNRIYTRSSTDGQNWTGWASNREGDTPSAVALTTQNNRLYQSIRGLDNNIYTRSSTDGVTWTRWNSNGGGQTLSAPALASFNGKLFQAHQGTDNKIYTRSSFDGIKWSSWSSSLTFPNLAFQSQSTLSAVTMTSLNGKLFQSIRGMDNKMYTRSSPDGSSWTSWASDKIGDTPDAPSLATFNGKLYQAHEGLNLRIYTRSSVDGVHWSNWLDGQGLTPTETSGLNVWKAEYYNNRSLAGQSTFSRVESRIDYDWGSDGPGGGVGNDNFSARWSGKFYFDEGKYSFKVRADDGVRLWIDNKLVINQWNNQPASDFQYDFNPGRGIHNVRLEYFENVGNAIAKFSWSKITLPTDVSQANSFFKLQYSNPTYNPTGPNSSENCGPASLAMVMDTLGVGSKNVQVETSIDHARYLMYGMPGSAITKEGIKIVDDDRSTTNWNQLDAGIKNAGGKSEVVNSWDILDQSLQSGKPVILYGYYDSIWRSQFPDYKLTGSGNTAHFNAVLGKTSDGKYIVADPMYRGGAVAMTRDQLTKFLRGPDNSKPGDPLGRAFALN